MWARSGIEICEHYEHLADCVDDMCFYRGAVTESSNHPTALYHLNTGNKFGGDPAIGAWMTYGLGRLNENLPAFLVCRILLIHRRSSELEQRIPAAELSGHAAASHGFADSRYGSATRRHARVERQNLDLIVALDKNQPAHVNQHELDARIASYELAFRMQAEMPGAIDLKQDPRRRCNSMGSAKRKPTPSDGAVY